MEAARLLTKLLILNIPIDTNCHFLKESASVYWLRSFRKIALSNKLPLIAIRSLTRGCSVSHFSSLIITFRSFPTDILINVLILERFVNSILSRFIHPNKRGGREATLFPKG